MKKTLLFLLSVLTFSVFGMGQTTYYVNASTGDNDNDGSQGSPWQKIQYAIDQADDGDIIQVAAGTYAESLHVYKSITINGALDQGNRPVIVPNANGGNVTKAIAIPLIHISFGDRDKANKISIPVVHLNNLVLDAENDQTIAYGIRADRVELLVENLLIRNLSVEYEAAGIMGYDLRSCFVSGSVIQHVEADRAYGIYLVSDILRKEDDPERNFQMIDNLIEDIYGKNEVIGISSMGLNDILIHGNTIRNLTAENIYSMPEVHGISLRGFSGIWKEDLMPEVTITDNLISGLYKRIGDESFNIRSNTGISLTNMPVVQIRGNEIIRPLSVRKGEGPSFFSSGPDTGIHVQGTYESSCQISENEITDPIFGMFLLGGRELMVDNNLIYRPMAGILNFGMEFGFAKSISETFATQLNSLDDLMTCLGELPLNQHETNKFPVSETNITYLNNTISGDQANEAMVGIMALFPIFFDKGTSLHQLLIEGNSIEFFEIGIFIAGNQGLETNVHQNVFNNNFVAIQGDESISDVDKIAIPDLYIIDATFNYYGRPEGPGFIGAVPILKSALNGVSEGVLYSPWLGFEPGTPPGQMTYYVDDSGDIQRAIDEASPGDIIRILGGEYIGHVDASGTGVTLYPGNSPACVTIAGDLTTDYGNTLVIDIEGLTPCTGYTQLDVDGNVDLNGMSLDIQLAYAPAMGDAFDIILSDNPIAGQFAQGTTATAIYGFYTYSFSITYDDNKVTLAVTEVDGAVPVPLSGMGIFLGIFLIMGVSVFAWYRKRKSNITS